MDWESDYTHNNNNNKTRKCLVCVLGNLSNNAIWPRFIYGLLEFLSDFYFRAMLQYFELEGWLCDDGNGNASMQWWWWRTSSPTTIVNKYVFTHVLFFHRFIHINEYLLCQVIPSALVFHSTIVFAHNYSQFMRAQLIVCMCLLHFSVSLDLTNDIRVILSVWCIYRVTRVHTYACLFHSFHQTGYIFFFYLYMLAKHMWILNEVVWKNCLLKLSRYGCSK